MDFARSSGGRKPAPPEKGSFPIDHNKACAVEFQKYMACLKSTDGDSYKCKPDSKTYLICRMENGLMAKEDLDDMGFTENPNLTILPKPQREKEGFVGGIR